MGNLRSCGMRIRVAAALAAAIGTYACGEGGTEPPPPDPPRPAAVAIAPDTLTFTILGETTQLAAEVRDQNGLVRALS